MLKYLLPLIVLVTSLQVSAQQYQLMGRVANTSGKSIGFGAVYIKNSTYGTVANERGDYLLRLDPGTYDVIFRHAGYKELTDKITIGKQDVRHNARMIDEVYVLKQLTEIKGHPADSAVGIMQKAIAKRKHYLAQPQSYTCAAYIKGVQKVVRTPQMLIGKSTENAFSIDSTGRGILYQTESISQLDFAQPDKVKEIMRATKSAGRNIAFSYNQASDLSANFYEDIFDVPGLSERRFVSPLAGNAEHYYNYELMGSKVENGIIVHKIKVIPKRSYEPVFSGYMYITDGDWRIYGVDLLLAGRNNLLNLADTLQITQEYVPVRDSVWEPLTVQYNFKGRLIGVGFEGYYLGIYNHYKIDPGFPIGYFNGEHMRIDSTANIKDSTYWQDIRPLPLTAQERADYSKKANLAELQKIMKQYHLQSTGHHIVRVLHYLAFGDKAGYRGGKDSLFVDPFLQTVYYNTVEGAGINLRATYTHYLDSLRSYSITPNLRYGFADKLLNANVYTTYEYDPLNRGKFTLDFGSNLFDLSNVGTRSLYFNTLSTLLSEQNFVKYYRSEFAEFGFQRELVNGILWQAGLAYANRTQLYNNSYYTFNTYVGRHLTSNNPLAPDAPANDRSFLFPQNQALTFATTFTFTFDQQYITRPTGREYLPSQYPQIMVSYRKGIHGLLGSDVDYDFASVTLYDEHLNSGLMGFSSFKLEAGDFFNRNTLYFMDYNHFLGNQGTTFNPTPGNFHYLPFYTYSTNGPYIEAHFEHNFSGFLFNKVPLLRKLKLQEIAGVNYLTENNNRNYSEYYIGVQRLIFRVDYGVAYAGNHRYLQGFRIFYGIK